MKAILCRAYGGPDVLALEEVAAPVPRPDEVLIRVRAAAVNPLDAHLMRGRPWFLRPAVGLRRPREPRCGYDVAGVVEAAGGSVARFRPGDEVFGSCRGAFAELACAAAAKLAAKPRNVTFEEAASAPVAAYTALQGLRDAARVGAGQRVLVNGAAGGVGTWAVQVAKWLGADVTAVCSAANAAMVRRIGANAVVDYAREEFTRSAGAYDAIFDLVGNHGSLACRRALRPDGIYVLAGVLGRGMAGYLAFPLKAAALAPFSRRRMTVLMAKSRGEDLAVIADLLGSGAVAPVIDSRFPLAGVPDAVRRLETKRARGKIVISVGEEQA